MSTLKVSLEQSELGQLVGKRVATATCDLFAPKHRVSLLRQQGAQIVLGVSDRTVMGIMGWSNTAMAALPAHHASDPARRGPAGRRTAAVDAH